MDRNLWRKLMEIAKKQRRKSPVQIGAKRWIEHFVRPIDFPTRIFDLLHMNEFMSPPRRHPNALPRPEASLYIKCLSSDRARAPSSRALTIAAARCELASQFGSVRSTGLSLKSGMMLSLIDTKKRQTAKVVPAPESETGAVSDRLNVDDIIRVGEINPAWPAPLSSAR
jgi:hypothetical protein